MNRLSVLVVVLLYAMPVQALSTKQWVGLFFCANGACRLGVAGLIITSAGLALAADDPTTLPQKIKQFGYDIVNPANAALSSKKADKVEHALSA